MASHTASVFLAGLAVQLAVLSGARTGSAALQGRISVAAGGRSGLLLVRLGIGLFTRRWRAAAGGGHGHDHDHGHDHHHPHPHPPGSGEPSGLWTLVGLGSSGGLVPCPGGIFIILLGLHYGRLLFSLVLLLLFSLALGGVLVGIGILVVTGRRLVPERWKALGAGPARWLPAASALFIAALGAYLTADSIRSGRTEIAGILEDLAGAIRP
jgi:ABC-type nickel/cobalt efflux system permease component RcnA